jgi:hypothetical protein
MVFSRSGFGRKVTYYAMCPTAFRAATTEQPDVTVLPEDLA